MQAPAFYRFPLGDIEATVISDGPLLLGPPSSDVFKGFSKEEMTRMLNHRILVRVYGWTDGCFEFNLDEKHMGDDRLKALVSATGRPVMLTNEARAKVNLPPVEGGDELVTPLNVAVGEKPSVDLQSLRALMSTALYRGVTTILGEG